MFAGFNLQGLDTDFLSSYKGAGEVAFNQQKNHIRKELDRFVLDDGSIDGSALQNDWFPEVEADIFLSHSHGDHKLTMAFAAMLEGEFGLTAFIDSCVWGYANDLLKKIDDVYCRNETGATYNYDKRNYSTSHVHMMLSTALTKMMDKTECLIFVNTPNSITTRDAVKDKTKSPWIYSEIATSSALRKKKPRRHNELLKKAYFEHSAGETKSLDINYDVDLNHLKDLSTFDIAQWRNAMRVLPMEDLDLHPLDQLYKEKKVLDFKFEAYHG
ncbi:hypothetical protein M1I95_21740 [Rossellomorea marisflavi]|uniref:hypothetical protein n=1 Tax=Rossellomorea marisflavi TaxID=189381 RepID=UPI00279D4025|nr:hypothetical protein [Rossellomorea marisflavi]UTE72815.1 hypothetical protein M1I95_21740 [Rossellomorea marisflavi]